MADKDTKNNKNKAKDKEEKKEEESSDPNDKISKKRRLILFAGIAGVVLLAITIGAIFITKTMNAKKNAELEAAQAESSDSGYDAKEKKEEKKEEAHKNETSKDDKGKKEESAKGTSNFGDTFAIPKMDLNLGNPIENRYLRIACAIEYRGGEEQSAELKKREIQIKDIIITTVTNKSRIQLLSENGKELLRREILNKINEVSDRPIQNVFFTEFLVE